MAQFGAIYKPLMARVQANRNNPGKFVAFIGKQICFFERESDLPVAEGQVEVMITRTQCGKHPEGHGWAGHTNWADVRGLLVTMVDRQKHMLVAINGFECSGSMCSTTARGIETDGRREYTSEDVWPGGLRPKPVTMWLTPGRCGVLEVSNVNAAFDKREPKARIPMNVWIERKIYDEKRGCGVRVAGLTRPEDGTWWEHIKARVEA